MSELSARAAEYMNETKNLGDLAANVGVWYTWRKEALYEGVIATAFFTVSVYCAVHGTYFVATLYLLFTLFFLYRGTKNALAAWEGRSYVKKVVPEGEDPKAYLRRKDEELKLRFPASPDTEEFGTGALDPKDFAGCVAKSEKSHDCSVGKNHSGDHICSKGCCQWPQTKTER